MAVPATHVFAILALAMDVIVTQATATLALANHARVIRRAKSLNNTALTKLIVGAMFCFRGLWVVNFINPRYSLVALLLLRGVGYHYLLTVAVVP